VPEGLEPGTPFSVNILALAIYLRFTHAISYRRLSGVSGGEDAPISGDKWVCRVPTCNRAASSVWSRVPSCSRPSRTLRVAPRRPSAVLDRRCARRHVRGAGRDDGMAALDRTTG
jgi:hypothetical protein